MFFGKPFPAVLESDGQARALGAQTLNHKGVNKLEMAGPPGLEPGTRWDEKVDLRRGVSV